MTLLWLVGGGAVPFCELNAEEDEPMAGEEDRGDSESTFAEGRDDMFGFEIMAASRADGGRIVDLGCQCERR